MENPFNIGDRVRRLDRAGPRMLGKVVGYLAFEGSWRVIRFNKTHICVVQWDDGNQTHYGYNNLELYKNGVEIMVDLVDEARLWNW